MFQLYKNIQTDFLRLIFLELFKFKTRSLFWDTQCFEPSDYLTVITRVRLVFTTKWETKSGNLAVSCTGCVTGWRKRSGETLADQNYEGCFLTIQGPANTIA